MTSAHLQPPPRRCPHTRGFTLVEMAIVLALFGLLVGGTLVVVSAQQEQQRIRTTEQTLRQASEALLGYALATTPADEPAYLPCPADPDLASTAVNFGREDRAGDGSCAREDGWLPWVTLGLGERDGWGQRVWYRVELDWSNPVGSPAGNGEGIGFATASSLSILDREANNNSCTGSVLAAEEVPVVLRSAGGTRQLDPVNSAASSGAPARDEFCTGPRVAGFDDLVQWVSPHLLKARLLAAGRL